MSPNDSHAQHIVTAVFVAHEGARWLPDAVQAALAQTRPVDRIVGVDTGSRDRSGSVLAGMLGADAVSGMDRNAGYGAAIAQALRHRAANSHVPGTGGDRVEWIWLLHDDCEPAPDALESLLRGADAARSAAVLGPKVMDWSDRQVIREAGVTIDGAGRRVTGIEPREIDQGQHDGDRDMLAVGSAGMLVRRDVWEQLGGFDLYISLFRDDVDFCWRVHAAGFRVRVITDAVVYHMESSARRRRTISGAGGHPRRLDRRNALYVRLVNLPVGAMLAAFAGSVAGSVLRALFYLLAKQPARAWDHIAALGAILGNPGQLLRARRRRRPGRRRAYLALRPQLPRGRPLRRFAEMMAGFLSGSASLDAAGMHHATDDPDEDDSLLTDNGFVQRILTSPGVLLFLALTVISLVAERSLVGAGPLGGGALVPAWGGASDLWREYLAGFHDTGVGSAASAPPYLAVVAALSTVLAGKPWLAVDVMLLGCVPLAGITAFLAVRRITRSVPARIWAAASYALLPVATGAVAGGRIGTAMAFVLVPLIGMLAGRMLTAGRRRARRAAWATGLLIGVATAFVPLVWVLAVVVVALAALAFGRGNRAMAANLGIVAAVPAAALFPWTFQLLAHPSGFLLEAGLQRPGLATPRLPARSLLLLSPGGPGLPPVWVTAGIGVTAICAMLLRRRLALIAVGWGVALLGLLIAIGVSRVEVMPAGGGPAVTAWPGIALAFAAAGILLAAITAAEPLSGLFAAGGMHRIGTLAVVVVAFSAPVLTAADWLANGVSGPVTTVASPVLPEFVSASSANALRLRTLVLRPGSGVLAYSVLRGADPLVGASELAEPDMARRALDHVVASLTAVSGGDVADEGQALAGFAVGYVLLPGPVDQNLARLLDGVPGLRRVSKTSSFELWRVVTTTARVRVVEPGGAVAALPSGRVNVSGAAAPPAGGTVVLAEPADGGWSATVDGHQLKALAPVDGWAQAFALPSGGGRLDITRDETSRDVGLGLEGAALLAIGVLALPGARVEEEDEVAEGAAPARQGRLRSRRPARRSNGLLGGRLRSRRGRARAPGTRQPGLRGAAARGPARRGVPPLPLAASSGGSPPPFPVDGASPATERFDDSGVPDGRRVPAAAPGADPLEGDL